MKILMSLLMAIMFLGGQAVAEEGDICDGQVGAAYGLCNAYCNAMECNSPEPQASDKACSRVSFLFEQITGTPPPGGDPPPPEDPVPCPVWTQALLQEAYEQGQCCYSFEDNLITPCPGGTELKDSCLHQNQFHNIHVAVYTYDGYNVGEIEFWSDEGLEIYYNEILLNDAQAAACTLDIMSHAFSCSCP